MSDTTEVDLLFSFIKYNVSEHDKILARQQPDWWNNMVGDNPTQDEFNYRCKLRNYY